MICWTGPERPTKQPVSLADRHVVDAGLTPAHQAIRVEFPLFIAVCAVPVPGIVVPFVLEAHRDAMPGDGPKLLDQPVIELPGPFAL